MFTEEDHAVNGKEIFGWIPFDHTARFIISDVTLIVDDRDFVRSLPSGFR